MIGKSILVVDDSPRVREALERMLSTLGCSVVTVASGQEAVAAMESVEFTVALVALRMPGISGHGLITPRAEHAPSLPLIAMSGVGTMDDVIQVLRRGANDFLKKPIQPLELKAALERIFHSQAETTGGLGQATSQSTLTLTPEQQLEHMLDSPEDGGTNKLPDAGPTFSAIRRLMADLTVGIREVLQVIEGDDAVEAALLHSTAAQLGAQGVGLKDVCIRLGNRRVLACAYEVVLRKNLALGKGPLAKIEARLWDNVKLTAYGALALALHLDLPDPDDIFVDALMHNVGEALLLRMITEGLPAEVVEDIAADSLSEELEQRHEQLGAELLRAWKMPQRVIRMAASHHSEERPEEETEDEALRRHLVLAAWTLALQSGSTYLRGQSRRSPHEHLEALGIPPDRARTIFRAATRWSPE